MRVTRSQLIVGGTALAASGITVTSSLLSAAAAATPTDVELLNGAIALERAGIKAYTDALALNVLSPGVAQVAKSFRSDHEAHEGALSAAVKAAGATPTSAIAKLTYPTLKSEADILAFAEKVERIAATSYLGDIGRLSDPALSKLMASILGVETTHVSTLAAALKQARPYSGFVS